jgi:hypothetical protein
MQPEAKPEPTAASGGNADSAINTIESKLSLSSNDQIRALLRRTVGLGDTCHPTRHRRGSVIAVAESAPPARCWAQRNEGNRYASAPNNDGNGTSVRGLNFVCSRSLSH